MGIELEAKSASELSLMDDNKVLQIWEEKANQRAAVENNKAKDERARAHEERDHTYEAEKKVAEAIERAEEAEGKATKSVDFEGLS